MHDNSRQKAVFMVVYRGGSAYVRGWTKIDSLRLSIRYSYKVKDVCHEPDSLLPLLIRQYRLRTSCLPPDRLKPSKRIKNHEGNRQFLTKRAVTSFLKSYPCEFNSVFIVLVKFQFCGHVTLHTIGPI